jgi:hypothetical protein
MTVTSRKAKAKIWWVPETEGGRKSPPTGPRYVTVVRFAEDTGNFNQEAWSLVVEFPETSNPAREMEAEVSFLVDEAPQHLIYPGSRFDLFEGVRIVARGEVL